MLVEFPSVVDAVSCAIEIQRAMVDRNVEVDPAQRIQFRAGINLGGVIVEAGDIFGDGVNVASRLEALAEPGGICISGTVRDHVGDRLPYAFEDMGEQSVKNIERPVHVYGMRAAAVAATALVAVRVQQVPGGHNITLGRTAIERALSRSPPSRSRRGGRGQSPVTAADISPDLGEWVNGPPVARPVTKPSPRLSIVVLPFANLSTDPDQEYFADGITDDLTADLSHISGSFVSARTTAFTYKGKPVDVKEIGHELGFRYVLEGSVRRSGEQVQVNAIDRYRRRFPYLDTVTIPTANPAKAQNEITSLLARTLQLELRRRSAAKSSRKRLFVPTRATS